MAKIIFIGTTTFGVPTLDKLKKEHDISLVVSQPDKPTGRSKTLTPPPIKDWAVKDNIRVLQPMRIADIESDIEQEHADMAIVAAYGQIIPEKILNIPKYGSINIHGSILPKYRGASPIQTAIMNGDRSTGITLIRMDGKMDHGPILAKQEMEIDSTDTYQTLHDKLARAAADLVSKTIPGIIDGTIKPEVQNHSLATYTKLFSRDDGRINWTSKAEQIRNQIRALNPEPGTWTKLDDKIIKILKAEILTENKIELPGRLYRKGVDLAVKCADYSLLLTEVQPEGKKPMSGSDFLNGLKSLETKIFV